MIRWLQKTLTLSGQGAKNLRTACIACTCYNLSLILPMWIIYFLLQALFAAFDGGDFAPKIGMAPYAGAIAAVLVICFIFTVWQYDSCFTSAYKESRESRISIAEKMRRLPLSFFGNRDLADLTTTIMSDVTGLEHGFSHFIPEMVGAALSLLVCSIGLFGMNAVMALSLIWVLPAALIVMAAGKKRLDEENRITSRNKVQRADGIQEFLDNIREIKADNQTEKYLGKLDAMLESQVGDTIRTELTNAVIVNLAGFLVKLALATVVVAGAGQLVAGKTTPLIFIVFMIAATRVLTPIEGCLINIAALFNTMTQIDRLKEVYREQEQGGSADLDCRSYDIEFDHVSFAYNTGEQVIRDVSFTAKQGEVTALIGPSGGGKSTCTKLAARFWDVSAGVIRIGGEDISGINPETLLKSYSIVFQDVLLFDASIMDNIRIGRKDATDEEVYAAARAACCESFIEKLPEGYQTVIGENGSRLSGRECQRISIARAILKNAPIVLLDEATASLDVENETEVQAALSRLLRGRTVLVIAHRMRTIANADHIIVLSGGKIAEEGSPGELWERNGIYRHMSELQEEAAGWQLC